MTVFREEKKKGWHPFQIGYQPPGGSARYAGFTAFLALRLQLYQ
jgi:hypothetical protein